MSTRRQFLARSAALAAAAAAAPLIEPGHSSGSSSAQGRPPLAIPSANKIGRAHV